MTPTKTNDPRPDLPLGYTYDARGRELTYKNSAGYWHEHTRDAQGNALTYKDSAGYWCERTYDAQGNALTYKNSAGYWHEHTRDAQGNALTYKDSAGYWCERTYDAQGNELTFKNSEDIDRVALAHADSYTLWFDRSTRKYHAGCREFTRAEALAHWGASRSDNRERAEIAINAINSFKEPQ